LPDDAIAVAALLAELGYDTTVAEMRSRLEGHNGEGLLVAARAGELLGMVAHEDTYYFPTHTTLCRITALIVPSSSRRQGVAGLLVESVVDGARARGCSGVEVTTALSRADAHGFYERIGFARTSYRYYQDLGNDRLAG
jgi:GNAT superfamily N-acetyltransferase